MYVKVGGWATIVNQRYIQVMTPPETRRSPNHLFHEVNLIELANGPGLDNSSWRYVSFFFILYYTLLSTLSFNTSILCPYNAPKVSHYKRVY